MKVRVFTVRFDPDSGMFDDRALQEFQQGRDLLDVSEHAFMREGTPTLALVVRFRETVGPSRSDEPRKDWRGELDDRGKVRYDQLRVWRAGTAKRDGLPPYLILSNREMAEIAGQCPASLAALQEIDGIGESKVKRWGEEMLAILDACGRKE